MTNTKRKPAKRPSSRRIVTIPEKKKNKVRLAIDCTPDERKIIKMYASFEDKTLNEFVMDCVRLKVSKCKHAHIPNKETAEALDATERGEGIIKFDSIEDFFKSMGE